jgi:hypothetical protein
MGYDVPSLRDFQQHRLATGDCARLPISIEEELQAAIRAYECSLPGVSPGGASKREQARKILR